MQSNIFESHYDDDKFGDNSMHCAIVACTKDQTQNCGSRFFPSDNLVPSVRFNEIRLSLTVEIDENEEEDMIFMPTNIDFRLLPLSTDSFTYTTGEMFYENK